MFRKAYFVPCISIPYANIFSPDSFLPFALILTSFIFSTFVAVVVVFLLLGHPYCHNSRDKYGDGCVWCELSRFGFCLSPDQAHTVQHIIPFFHCDNDSTDDGPIYDDGGNYYDDGPHYDDVPQYDDGAYHDDVPQYDDAPQYDDEPRYDDGHQSDDGAYYDDEPRGRLNYDPTRNHRKKRTDKTAVAAVVKDPFDTSCLQATVDQASCDSSTDSEGNQCQFCDIAGVSICLNPEQAQAAQMTGGDCVTTTTTSTQKEKDPYDPTCLQSSLDGDESTCEATVDSDGNSCEWCSVASVNLCLSSEQAEAAQLLGGSCN